MKKPAYYFVFQILLILNIEIVISQPTQEWVAFHNGQTGSNVNTPYSIAADDLGNIYVNGESYFNSGSNYCATLKYSPIGNLIWANMIPVSTGWERMVLDSHGSVYVGTSVDSASYTNFLIIKYNSNGSADWSRTVNGPGNRSDVVTSIFVDDYNDVYVCGSVYVSFPSNYSYEVVKFDSSGIRKWSAVYGSLGFSAESYIGVDHNKNVYVGFNHYASVNNNDYGVVKYDSNGSFQWARFYDGPAHQHDFLHGMKVSAAGDVYVTGQSIGSGSGSDYATLKYNSQGDLQWERRYNGTANQQDYAYWIEIDPQGNAYVTGASSVTNNVYDYVTIKYSSGGDQMWLADYDGPGHDEDVGTCLKLDTAGNVYVTGASNGGASSTDFATVKYNNSGVLQWVVRYNGSANFIDYATVLTLDKNGNVIVSGKSQDSSFNYRFVTVKYSQTIGIKRISNTVPENFRLYQNYPNPFNPSTKIRFDIPEKTGNDPVKLTIYDILGRELEILVNDVLKPGRYEAEWNGINVSSGLYFCNLLWGSFADTKKIVLLR